MWNCLGVFNSWNVPFFDVEYFLFLELLIESKSDTSKSPRTIEKHLRLTNWSKAQNSTRELTLFACRTAHSCRSFDVNISTDISIGESNNIWLLFFVNCDWRVWSHVRPSDSSNIFDTSITCNAFTLHQSSLRKKWIAKYCWFILIGITWLIFVLKDLVLRVP